MADHNEAQPAGLAEVKSLDDYRLEEHLEGPHEWGYRDPVVRGEG